MIDSYDYIILGAGASGLMLSYRMATDSFFDDKSILIIDNQKRYSNDKTWCFWEESNGEWDNLLSKTWNSILFKSDNFISENVITPYQYKMIRSGDFYSFVWSTLEEKNNITFVEQIVKEVSQDKNNAKVITDRAEYTSKNVLNSIILSEDYKKETHYPLLQQHFVGFFIKTEADSFNDSIATFMDFSVSQKENTRFMYVLPYNTKEALFEYTLFSSEFLAYEEYVSEIKKYLKEKGITNYQITAKEKGAIPMTCFKFWNYNSSNILHIGTAGGWSKPSTGFTFKNTSKNTKHLVSFLKSDKDFTKFHKKTKFWFYDLLLLDILKEKNYLGSYLFSKMFKNIETRKILKFLDNETSIFEDVQIILKMPFKPFIKALFKRVF